MKGNQLLLLQLYLSCIFSLTGHTQAADDDLPGGSHTLTFKGRGGELALM